MWFRKCPECDKEIVYKYRPNFYTARKKNSLCKSCIQTGKRHKYFGKSLPKHVIELKRKQMRGELNPNFGGFTEQHKENLRMSLCNSEKIKELGRSRRGIPRSKETKRKIRRSIIKDLKTKCGYQLSPNYNKHACQVFEEINRELNWNGIHAENGGEFHIKELGYWVDYYEPNLNIVIEYDEKRHRKQQDKDIYRQREIEQHLQCKFYRIPEGSSWKDALPTNEMIL